MVEGEGSFWLVQGLTSLVARQWLTECGDVRGASATGRGVETQSNRAIIRLRVGGGCGGIREGGEGDQERYSKAVQGNARVTDSPSDSGRLCEWGGAAGGQGTAGGRHPSCLLPGGSLLAQMPDPNDHQFPGGCQRQGERGACEHGTMPNSKLGTQGDRDGNPRKASKVVIPHSPWSSRRERHAQSTRKSGAWRRR